MIVSKNFYDAYYSSYDKAIELNDKFIELKNLFSEMFGYNKDDEDEAKEFDLYVINSKKYKEFYFAGKRPIIFQEKGYLPPYYSGPRLKSTLFSDDIYVDVEEMLTKMMCDVEEEKKEEEKLKKMMCDVKKEKTANRIITVTFFKDFSTTQTHTPKFLGVKPIMYDLIPYLKRSKCIGITDVYPYNAIRFENFRTVEIMQIMNKKK